MVLKFCRLVFCYFTHLIFSLIVSEKKACPTLNLTEIELVRRTYIVFTIMWNRSVFRVSNIKVVNSFKVIHCKLYCSTKLQLFIHFLTIEQACIENWSVANNCTKHFSNLIQIRYTDRLNKYWKFGLCNEYVAV